MNQKFSSIVAISPTSSLESILLDQLNEFNDANIKSIVGSGFSMRTPIESKLVVMALPKGNRKLLNAVQQEAPDDAAIVVYAPEADLRYQTEILSQPKVIHVVGGIHFKEDIRTTVKRVVSNDVFGIEHFLPQKQTIIEKSVSNYQDRKDAIQSVVDFAKSNKIRRQQRLSIENVCEELLMNALYDAPVDSDGNQIFEHVSTKDRLTCESPQPVYLRYSFKEGCLILSVTDSYGRLKKDRIISYLDKCLNTDDQIDNKTYGAGLGIYIIANASSRYLVNVIPGKKTETICTFDTDRMTSLKAFGFHRQHN